MRVLLAFVCLSVLCDGCATVEMAGGKLRPVSYSSYGGTKDYGIGLLRRIAILPPQYVYMHNGKRQPNKEAEGVKLVRISLVDFLENWSGYEVVKPEDGKVPNGEWNLSETVLKSLYEWAGSAAMGSVPPTELREALDSAIGEAKVDGLLLFQCFLRPPSTWNVGLLMLTGSLSFPLVLAEKRGELEAAVIERSSGELVWRSKRQKYDVTRPVLDFEIHNLLYSLGRAVPAALTE